MGNRMAREDDSESEGKSLSLFGVASMIVHDKIPSPMSIPICLDELVDWTQDASVTANTLHGVQVLPNKSTYPVLFQAFVRNRRVVHRKRHTAITQKDVINFPADHAFERVAFYEQHILICLVFLDAFDENQPDVCSVGVVCTISGLDFCIYIRLLRRLAQLSELTEQSVGAITNKPSDSHECGICFDNPQETILPCLHGMCKECEAKWVETHQDCPFCREQYTNRRRRHREQWQLESWSRNDVQEDVHTMEQQIKNFWEGRVYNQRRNGAEGFTQLNKSFQESIVDDGFVLLH